MFFTGIPKSIIVAIGFMALCFSVAAAQSASPTSRRSRISPDSEYALRVATVADSTVILLRFLDDQPTKATSTNELTPGEAQYFGKMAQVYRPRVVERANDFDVHAPPKGLERVHAQLVSAIRRVGTTVDSASGWAHICDNEMCLNRTRNAIVGMMDARREYLAARARASSVLQERGLSLAPLAKYP